MSVTYIFSRYVAPEGTTTTEVATTTASVATGPAETTSGPTETTESDAICESDCTSKGDCLKPSIAFAFLQSEVCACYVQQEYVCENQTDTRMLTVNDMYLQVCLSGGGCVPYQNDDDDNNNNAADDDFTLPIHIHIVFPDCSEAPSESEDIQDALRTNVAYIGGLAPENVHLLQFSIVRDEFDNIIVNMAIEIVGENNAHVQAASDAITMMMMRTGVVAQQLLGTIFSMRRLPKKKMEHFRTDFAFFLKRLKFVCVCVCV